MPANEIPLHLEPGQCGYPDESDDLVDAGGETGTGSAPRGGRRFHALPRRHPPAHRPLHRRGRSQRRSAALDRLRGLTGREREVLVEIGLGRANSDIAAHLHMSEATVKTHVSHLFDKLAATNRVQLAIAAYRAGEVE